MSNVPVLRIRATDPLRFTEIKLGDVDLIPLFVTDIQIQMNAREVTRATLTFHVIPDVELPAAVEALIVNPLDEATS